MVEAREDIGPAGWQITATTMLCEVVADYVTVMVNRDWSCRCTWCDRYKLAAESGAKKKFSGAVRSKIAACRWPQCSYVLGYRDRLIAEESAV